MTAPSWWQSETRLFRFIRDLVLSELRRLRPSHPPLAVDLSLSTEIDGDGLDADSLEVLSLASAVADALQLRRSGIEDYLLARRTMGDWVMIARAGLERFDGAMTFRTSGSQGQPKPVEHPMSALEQEVAYLGAELRSVRRILTAVPAHHIYGFLFTILLPTRLSAEVVEISGVTPATVTSRLQEGDCLVAYPDWWRLFADHSGSIGDLPALVGVTSTAPCPTTVYRDVLERGLPRLVEVYGSTETAGVGWRTGPEQPFRLFPYWSRDACNPGTLIRRNRDGTVQSTQTPDHLDWIDEHRFVPAGRQDGVVQVGGINVSPEHVARVLARHPAVAEAQVRLMDPSEGTRLKAFIVPAGPVGDQTAMAKELASWARSELASPEQPKSYQFGARLPVGPQGKPANWPA